MTARGTVTPSVNGTVKFITTCPWCENPNALDMLEPAALRSYLAGESTAADLFPRLSASELEVLVSGSHATCWSEMFPPDAEEAAPPAAGCAEACWTPVPCPSCGDDLPPRGRAMPPEMGIKDCCDAARMDSKVNPRHLWREDEDSDPEGELPSEVLPPFDLAEVKARILARIEDEREARG